MMSSRTGKMEKDEGVICKEEKNETETVPKKKRQLQRPKWLDSLLGESFFTPCEDHKELRKNDTNSYCLDCDERMCQNCMVCSDSPKYVDHAEHNLLQVRRYVYQDVVRIQDIQKFLDCTKIQPFVVNGAKVILLNPKKGCKANGKECHVCVDCGRTISDPNLYCSIACKVTQLDRYLDDGDQRRQSPLITSSVVDDNVGTSSSMPSTINIPSKSEEAPDQDSGKEAPAPPPAFRKRKRKGIPVRSHLF